MLLPEPSASCDASKDAQFVDVSQLAGGSGSSMATTLRAQLSTGVSQPVALLVSVQIPHQRIPVQSKGPRCCWLLETGKGAWLGAAVAFKPPSSHRASHQAYGPWTVRSHNRSAVSKVQ